MMHHVAVYGSLKDGFGNHRLLEQGGALFLGGDWVDGWTMYSLGGFPAIAEGDGLVRVEIYEVDELTFSRLDRLEGFPHFYNRKQISTEYGDTWIYYHEEEPSHAPIVESGEW